MALPTLAKLVNSSIAPIPYLLSNSLCFAMSGNIRFYIFKYFQNSKNRSQFLKSEEKSHFFVHYFF